MDQKKMAVAIEALGIATKKSSLVDVAVSFSPPKDANNKARIAKIAKRFQVELEVHGELNERSSEFVAKQVRVDVAAVFLMGNSRFFKVNIKETID